MPTIESFIADNKIIFGHRAKNFCCTTHEVNCKFNSPQLVLYSAGILLSWYSNQLALYLRPATALMSAGCARTICGDGCGFGFDIFVLLLANSSRSSCGRSGSKRTP